MANKRFFFSVLATTILTAKCIHILANTNALPRKHLVQWGYSFFGQDLLLLSLVRYATTFFNNGSSRPSRSCVSLLCKGLLVAFIAYSIIAGIVSTCFFAFNGSELHYRNLGFVKDSSARAVLLSGLLTATVVIATILAVSRLFQEVFFFIFGLPEDALILGWQLLRSCVRGRKSFVPPQKYQYKVRMSESDDSDTAGDETKEFLYEDFTNLEPRPNSIKSWLTFLFQRSTLRYLACLVVVVAAVLQLTSLAMRPPESSLAYLSWTAPFLPFVDFGNSSPYLTALEPVYGNAIGHTWDNRTALSGPPSYSWLPQDSTPAGFDDWYGQDKQHYNAKSDPLKDETSARELLPGLAKKLKDVDIRHVLFIFLESTRKDVFPIKKNEIITNRFAGTYKDHKLPPEVLERLATLTPTARHLTGDLEDGFEHDTAKGTVKHRGGLNFQNALTAATYTKKSQTGSLCGVYPLVADFNREFEHHLYQPCLPQILDFFNSMNANEDDLPKPYASFNWTSYFMESTTIKYDNSGPLFEAIGFPPDQILSKEYLKSPSAKFGKVDLPDINYFGMEETPLEDYIHDAFAMAAKKDERVFLTHITSTSHHPYAMPADETYVPMGHDDALKDMSHYVNAVGYDDRWLAKILEALEKEGVANETLVVLHGDHGLSIPENDILASYYNPNVGCDRVPLVFSHPQLPSLQVESLVSTSQVLPTILDLLAETQSLSHDATTAARDLASNYEGASLIRSTIDHTAEEARELDRWQFVIMNPGRAMVGVRDRRKPEWRLVVPVLANMVWRFSDLAKDPTEAGAIVSFSFPATLEGVEKKYGREAAEWAEEAAFVARWWVEENSKRWHFGPYAT